MSYRIFSSLFLFSKPQRTKGTVAPVMPPNPHTLQLLLLLLLLPGTNNSGPDQSR
jgi:hypothetical protein